jgi:hypothetical protein
MTNCTCLHHRLCIWPAQGRRQCTGNNFGPLAAPHIIVVGLLFDQHEPVEKPNEATHVPQGLWLQQISCPEWPGPILQHGYCCHAGFATTQSCKLPNANLFACPWLQQRDHGQFLAKLRDYLPSRETAIASIVGAVSRHIDLQVRFASHDDLQVRSV